MKFFYTIWYLIQLWIAIYLVVPFLFLLIHFFKKAIRKQFRIDHLPVVQTKDFDFAAIVTAHKDTLLLPALVDSLLKQQYAHYTIYLVADSCDTTTLNFQDPRVIVLKPEIALNSKVRSIDYALAHFRQAHDALVIFDADNLVHPQFLHTINHYFQKGFLAVQGNLQPKNTDSVFARMDAMGDSFYNFLEREMRMELGYSSAIWGSGLAIETEIYRSINYENPLGGFDKYLQWQLVKRLPQIAFAREAIVYDEKISSGLLLEKQRTRWIHAYFKYLGLGWKIFVQGLKEGNFNRIFFGFFNLRPPLFIIYFTGILLCLAHFWIQPWLAVGWLIILFVFMASFLTIIILKTSNKKNIWSICYLPLFLLHQIAALIKIKKANKTFLKTEHSKLVYIEDLIRNEPV